MLSIPAPAGDEVVGDVASYVAAVDAWLAADPDILREVGRPVPSCEERVAAMSRLMGPATLLLSR